MHMKIGLIHTSATLVPVFQALCVEKLPGVPVFHISDDSLIKDVISAGKLTPQVARRVCGQILLAQDAGASHVLVTCSSIGEAVEAAAGFAAVPVLRVDQPMADLAVATGRRIGVIATLPTTLDPTRRLVERRALANNRQVEVSALLCEGAFDALMAGDSATHDRIVRAGLEGLLTQCDVIVLAQASMARVVETLPAAARRIPILSSPALAVDHLAKQVL
jgi:Asp/Glu/hydantoin racemase